MSSPMYDLPEHYPMPVDANGDGPTEEPDTIAVVCWCGTPGCHAFGTYAG